MRSGNLSSIRTSKHIAFFFFFSIVYNFSFAAIFNPTDTVAPTVKEHKLNRAAFLEKFGRDDSSRALINFYFTKRKKSKKMILISIISIAVLSVAVGLAVANNANSQYPGTIDDLSAFFLIVLFGTAIYGAVALIITGIIRLMIYSRKKLLHLLKNYYAGYSLPPRITKSKAFALWMSVERRAPHPHTTPQFHINE